MSVCQCFGVPAGVDCARCAPSVTNPDHYARLDPQPIDVIEAWGLGPHLSNVIKYVSRAGHKPGADVLDDLKKARWYLDRYIGLLEAAERVRAGLRELAERAP